MIKNPIIIVFVLLLIEVAVLSAAAHPRSKHFFRFIPAVFWIYCLPMLVSSAGWIDTQSPLYGYVTAYALPASLFLLLLGVDLKAIARLGRTALFIFLAGSIGIMVGTAASFSLFHPLVGDIFWKGFGTLSASWMGGSANMVAVKEAMGTPDDIFLPMVVVDTIVPYMWMGFLIFVSTWQASIDRFNQADQGLLEGIRERMACSQNNGSDRKSLRLKNVSSMVIMASGVSIFLSFLSKVLPVVPGVISAFTWTIILVSLLGLICSLTPMRNWEELGSTKIGYYLLYFVLTTIGAKATITHLGDSVILVAAGFVIVLVHAVILFLVVRFLKAPLMLAATASQANLGGVASAPIVAEIYQPGLSTIGLLMAVLGNVIGTYLGILVGQICRWITSL